MRAGGGDPQADALGGVGEAASWGLGDAMAGEGPSVSAGDAGIVGGATDVSRTRPLLTAPPAEGRQQGVHHPGCTEHAQERRQVPRDGTDLVETIERAVTRSFRPSFLFCALLAALALVLILVFRRRWET